MFRTALTINEFRLDPHLLVTLLRGRWSNESRRLWSAHLDVARRQLLRQLAEATSRADAAHALVERLRADVATLAADPDADAREQATLELEAARGDELMERELCDALRRDELARIERELALLAQTAPT